MSREKFWYGPTPADESCAQVGSPDYSERAYVECLEYKKQLKRVYEAAHGSSFPKGFNLVIAQESHDFGRYYEVVGFVDTEAGPGLIPGLTEEESAQAYNAAFWLDSNCPAMWDEQARESLDEQARESLGPEPIYCD